jgi:hypothetical protein
MNLALLFDSKLSDSGNSHNQERQHFSVKLKWVPSDFSAKNLLAVYAFGGPDSSAAPRFDPTGGRNIGSRMT